MKPLKLLASLFLLMFPLLSTAQQVGHGYISGLVVDDGGQPIMQAGVQVLAAGDSSMIRGTVTDMEGRFTIKADPGDYIIKFSFIGFTPQVLNIHQIPSQGEQNIGTIALAPESTLLESSIVKANADLVTIKSDTVVFSTAAYHVADDATIGDLLKKIPGLEIDEDGGVRLHGREVKQLFLNGKRYFGGNVKTGLKNIPADMIENIAAYDRQSEFSRLTGIDDGEEEPVLDLKVKKSMMNGWRGTVNGGYGTSGRYQGRVNANKITEEDQSTLIANISNVGGTASKNTVNRNVLGRGGRGEMQGRDAGYSFAGENTKRKIEGHVQYSGDTKHFESKNSSTSVYSSSTSYGLGNTVGDNNNNQYKADMNLQLKVSPKINILIRPDIQYKRTDNYNGALGKTYSADPLTLEDPTSKQSNSTDNNSKTGTDDFRTRVAAQFLYRFGKKNNNNISLRLEGGYTNVTGDNLYDNTSYKKATSVVSSTRKQSIWTNDNTISSRVQVSGNFQIVNHWRANLSLYWDHKVANNDRQVFDLSRVDPEWTIKKPRPAAYRDGFDTRLSSSGQYLYDVATIYAGIFYFKKKFTVSAGVNLRPQWGSLRYPVEGIEKRNESRIFTVAPNINIKFNRLKNKRLQFSYKSWVGAPSLYNLLPVSNGTSITTIHMGNPDLKPSMTQKAEFIYNSSNKKRHNSFLCNVYFEMLSNAASNSSEYDSETGVRTITPKNIDGNWNVFGNFAYNKTFKDQRFSLSANTSGGYYNTMSYLYNKTIKADEINQATRLMARQTVDASFRHEWLEIVLNGAADLTRERSLLRPDLNRLPYSFRGGCSFEVFFPWKMRLGTDFTANIQRGLAYEEFNRNYFLLNAELSQTILKGKGTVKVEAYDILGQQVNVVQTFSSESRSIRTFNGVNRFIIAKFIYRFKL